ncbi:MAG: PEP-CTERM sorting domain-containing protein [Candidatus Accumulibacter sp.]|uniref:PEP-CTERM sorting domain-containing protein n=1 Tax=Accumulibacter sp. TaxID=2053492 RepID=UPI00287920A8|nr:PEP-CTERM sorting domain-containing protein [Accumulibacter sp.]MDS4016149.1 PEP-CTERM sorting domain-containing protein [Accumulibacter sp.]
MGSSMRREAAVSGVSGQAGTQQQVFRSAEKFATIQRHPLQPKYRKLYGGVIDAVGARSCSPHHGAIGILLAPPPTYVLGENLMHKLISLLALSSLALPVLADPVLVVPEPESLSLLAVAAVAMLATVVRRGKK